MRFKKALQLRDSATASLRSIFIDADSCHPTHGALLKELSLVRQNLTANKAPQWVTSFYDGYQSALFEAQQKEIEFCSKLTDQSLVSHNSSSPRYYQKKGHSPADICNKVDVIETGQYWIKSGQPYFVSEGLS
tara:strand:+ start:328 stop:726 length:399 start_codon:yes stop_codon:yes gene_type:complete